MEREELLVGRRAGIGCILSGSSKELAFFRQAEVLPGTLCGGKGKGKEVALYAITSICWFRKPLAPQMANGAGD